MPPLPREIEVSYKGETRTVPTSSSSSEGTAQLLRTLALAFRLPAGQGVAGFSQGRVVFPAPLLLPLLQSSTSVISPHEPLKLLVGAALPPQQQQLQPQRLQQDDDVVMSFPLLPDNLMIHVTQREINLMRFVRSKTVVLGHNNHHPPSRDELEACFAKHMTGQQGSISKTSFDHLARSLFPQTRHTPEHERKALSSSLSRIFYAFDRDNKHEVLGRDLFTAFGVLLSKHGLEFAFQLADANGDGFVDKQEFFTFTRAFLTLVLALNSSVSQLSASKVSASIDATANEVLHLCFQQADLNKDELLTWNEFSNWYSQHDGHRHVPWVRFMVEHTDDDEEGAGVAALSSSSSGRSPEEETVYEFQMAKGYGTLRITRGDVALLERLLSETGLYERDLQDTVALFNSRSDDDDDDEEEGRGGGLLSKESYDVCLRRLLGNGDRNGSSSIETQAMLQNVFFAFDRGDQHQHVRVDELCTGFSLLLRGTKSAKLQLCFSLFEDQDEEDEGITEEAFTRFLRSVLTMLFALNEGAALMTASQVFEMVDMTCAQVSRAVLAHSSKKHKNRRITFQDFADFYNTGSELVTFVELLDLNKFTLSSHFKHRLQQAPKHEDKRVFAVDLPVGKFEILQSDADRLQRIVQHQNSTNTSRFADMSVDELVQRAVDLGLMGKKEAAAAEWWWSRKDFDRMVGQEHSHHHNVFFDRVFAAFQTSPGGEHVVVSGRQMLCALSVLCGRGKKSQKLEAGFELFSIHTQRDLAAYLQSYLAMLHAIAVRDDVTSADFKRTVWQVCVDLSERIVSSSTGGAGLAFEDFAAWYGQHGGYKVASFLELLDQSKWPFHATAESTSPATAAASPAASPASSSSSSVFVFQLTKEHTLVVSNEDVEFVKDLVIASGLSGRSADDVLAAFAASASASSKYLTQEDFMRVLAELDVGERAAESLLVLFELGDRSQVGRCKPVDLFAGLVLLCGQGSKSHKLAACWSFLASESSSNNMLTREDLYALFRALVSALFAFNLEANSRPIEDTFAAVDQAATVLTGSVFLLAQRKQREGIAFEEFADFYSQGRGYELAPWLELLNLPKFVGGSSPSSPPQHNNNQQSDDVVFSFALEAEDGDGELGAASQAQLIVTQQDIADLHALLHNSRLGGMDPETLAGLVADEVASATATAGGGGEQLLTEAGFGNFVGQHVLLVRGEEDENDDGDDSREERVATALRRVFDAFDVEGAGAVPPAPLCVGLCLLAQGSKSAKLSVAWNLFSTAPIPSSSRALNAAATTEEGSSEDEEEDGDDDEMGTMDEAKLGEFLRALLTAVSCFAGSCLSDSELCGVSRRAAKSVVLDLGQEHITFTDFADWYTTRGFESLSWIELLSSAKLTGG